MKTLSAPARSPGKRRISKWIPGGSNGVSISKTQAGRFTDGLLKIAGRIEDCPPILPETTTIISTACHGNED
jgi:hypothetical protein